MELYQKTLNYSRKDLNLSIKNFSNLYEMELKKEWDSISWDLVTGNIFEIQKRIFFYVKDKSDYEEVRKLEEILLKIDSVILYVIKKNFDTDEKDCVSNVYKKALTNEECMALFYKVKHANFHMIKRKLDDLVSLSRKKENKLVNNDVLLIYNIIKNIMRITLEPRFEAIFEHSSYGCRPFRKREHALAHIYKGVHDYPWIFSSEFKICINKLNKKWIMEKLYNFPAKKIICTWLESYLEKNNSLTVNDKTPLLLNVILNGIESTLNITYNDGRLIDNNNKYQFIRYKNKFVVLSKSKEDVKAVPYLIKEFLDERNIELNHEKTVITEVNEGFDFLGLNIRYFNKKDNKIIIQPSNNSIKKIKLKLKNIYKNNIGNNVTKLITEWNEVLFRIAYYWRYFSSKKAFKKIDYYLWILTTQFLKKLHPNKSKLWIRNKYFKKDYKNDLHKAYILTDPKNNFLQLQKISWTKIKHVKIIKPNYHVYNENYLI